MMIRVGGPLALYHKRVMATSSYEGTATDESPASQPPRGLKSRGGGKSGAFVYLLKNGWQLA